MLIATFVVEVRLKFFYTMRPGGPVTGRPHGGKHCFATACWKSTRTPDQIQMLGALPHSSGLPKQENALHHSVQKNCCSRTFWVHKWIHSWFWPHPKSTQKTGSTKWCCWNRCSMWLKIAVLKELCLDGDRCSLRHKCTPVPSET